jgi:hypothetical protein
MNYRDKATVEIELVAKNYYDNTYMVRIGEYVFHAPANFVNDINWKAPWHPEVGKPATLCDRDVDVLLIDEEDAFIRYQDCGEADVVPCWQLESPDE